MYKPFVTRIVMLAVALVLIAMAANLGNWSVSGGVPCDRVFYSELTCHGSIPDSTCPGIEGFYFGTQGNLDYVETSATVCTQQNEFNSKTGKAVVDTDGNPVKCTGNTVGHGNQNCT